MSHPVTVRPLYTDADLDAALARLDAIFHAEPGTPEGDERAVLAVLIHAYEREHHSPDGPVEPVAALRFHMERLGLRDKDLVPQIGSQPRVSEVLSGKRPLTVPMIARLSRDLGIAVDDLIGDGDSFRRKAA